VLEAECPRCGANVVVEPEIVLGRAILACPGCEQATDLDPTRAEAAATFRARRTFFSGGPKPSALRRFRVEVAPIAELPVAEQSGADPQEPPTPAGGGDALPDTDRRQPPYVAAAPALGREPFGLGDTPDAAVQSLQRIVKRLGAAGLLPAPLPPSDADPRGRWIEASS